MNSSSLSAARTPFIRLLVPLLAGILYQEFLCLPIWGNLIPALCGLVLWSSFIKRDSIEEQYHKRSIFGVGLFLIVFSIGAILHGTQNRISQQPSGFYPIAIAHVNDKAVEKTNSYYCPVTITALSDTNGSIVKYKEKIALYFEKGIQARRLEYGDIIGFEFRPKAIPPNTNPYAFDFASFMKHKGISRSQYLTGKQWKYIGEKPKSNLRKATSDLQKHLSDQLQSCNLSKNSTLLLRALLLGERQEFPQDLRSYFSAAGLSHVLAVSGLHMGVVASLIYFLFFPPLSFQVLQKTETSIHFIRFMDLCLYNRLIAIGRTSLYHGILSFNSRISRPTQQFSQCTFRRSIFYVIVRHEPHFRCGISNEFLGSNRYLAILLQTKYRR